MLLLFVKRVNKGSFMNILYISTAFPKPENGSTIYTDLAESLAENNHSVTVVVAEGKSGLKKTTWAQERGLNVLRVRTDDYYNVGLLRKGFASLTMARAVKKAIINHLDEIKFDFILFESPPVTMYSVVKWAMKHFNCSSFLMLKDIFPQNGADIGLYKKNGIIFKYFKSQEQNLYKTATYIGCMSQANIDYILKHNKYLLPDKTLFFPNTKKVKCSNNKGDHSEPLRDKYCIPHETVLAVFGGNMGKPQGIDAILDLVRKCKERDDVFFLLVGRGTERPRINEIIKNEKLENIRSIESLPRDEYEKLLNECDIGLIFLDHRFTIPNFPSRVLSYFEYAIPVLAATDSNTDFGEMIISAQAGLWSNTGDAEQTYINLDTLVKDSALRNQMGINGKRYMEKHYDVSVSVKILENCFLKKRM